MSSANRPLLAACLATLLSCAPLLATHAAPVPAWPQASSDIAPDPAVRFGALPNGLRYAILKNATPTGQVSLRLRIGAGSLEEKADQQGLAHFLEHMAFRGSRRVADGDVKKTLERLGLKFGPDTNAFTAFTQTVYMFDLPRNDNESLDTGLMLLREVGDGLTLDAKAFDSERGVVLSEARLRDTPAMHMTDDQQSFIFKDQLVAQRLPIGKVAIIQNAPVTKVREFYRDWYRPDNATLVVVGDIDPGAIEAKIRQQFSSWHGAGSPPPAPDYGTVVQRTAQARAFAETGAPTMLSLNWVTPFDTSPDSSAREKRELIEQLGLTALNRRLQTAAAAASRTFTGAALYRANLYRSAKVTTLLVQHEPGKWLLALNQAERLRRQALAQGLEQSEVDREKAGFLSGFENAAAGAATRTTPQLANSLLQTVDDGSVFTSPAQDLALVRSAFADLKADTVNAALRGVFTGNGPLLFSSGPQAIAGGDSTLADALALTESSALPEAAKVSDVPWPYTDFGAPGKVLEMRSDAALDTTLIRFANGVRLNVHPTAFRKDQILVSVRVGDGRLALPKDRPTLAWAVNDGALVRGGLGKMDFETMLRALSGKIYGGNIQFSDDALYLSGQTRPVDLGLQMQVLAAYVSDPGLREEALTQVQSSFLPQLAQINSVPGSLFQVNLGSYLHSGDARWAFPTAAQVQGASIADFRQLLQPTLANGPIEITIVGDTTVDTALEFTARTFGALPDRTAPRLKAAKGDVVFPAATTTPVVLEHQGGADQGVAAVAWPTTDAFADLRANAARQLLAEILQQRLFETLRLKDNTSYSPSAQSQSSPVFPGYGTLVAYADIPPAKSQLFFDAEHTISAALRSKPVSADELERARAPAVANLAKARQTNEYWLGMLSGIQSEPRLEQIATQTLDNLRNVTAKDVQQAAITWLRDDHRWEMIVRPAANASAAPGPAPPVPATH